ncbi:MAG: hypothetical protein M3530_07050 [Thermoproteota archaeon]|nr:hypothetical protein [Thermoproteota archaeon]
MKATNIRQVHQLLAFKLVQFHGAECIQYGIRVGVMMNKLKKTNGRNKERSYYALTTKTWKRC